MTAFSHPGHLSARALLPAFVFAACVFLAPSTDPHAAAFAQADGKKAVILQPPTPPTGQSGDGAGFLTYGFGILLAGIVLGICFLPSKRGHQD